MSELQPKKVFDIFKQINAVPRPSKHEEKMIEFLRQFAAERNLPFKTDECGNVIISKEATPGMEKRAKVVMQGHMDMVCEKNGDVDFDFYHDAIQTYVDGEWMKAKGTTLGADCGIGDALALAILDADDVEHGPIECLFTRDEETGLTGAFEMKPGFMTGKYLINLDSEDEGEIFVGCAGGVNTTATFHYSKVDVPQGYFSMKVSVTGLQGGHSGDDINKNRANANKLLARFLYLEMQKMDVFVSEIQGGNLHNAIPREASAIISVSTDCKETVKVDLNIFAADVETEFSVTEKNLAINVTSTTPQTQAIDKQTACNLVFALQAAHNGVLAMSQDIEGLVETSSNLASIKMRDNEIVVLTSQRSSIGSARDNMANTIQAVFRLAGAEVVSNDGYPGWKPNPDSELLKIAVNSYKSLFGKEPKVKAIHAGLECGLFSEKYPGLDMVSFGPTLRGVHSPDEKLLIPTVQMVWDHLIDILKNIPEE
ncbi:MAG: aminoacyl-histidine dipeptidase [Bacteroidaceae bacterium]|nr:aminoacyl-histidine dipeptidase [Bacteroidaceae bacterium]